MTLEPEGKICATCSKSGCTAMCFGCQQSFCTKHFIKHRLYLSQQMKNLHEKQEIFQHDLDRDSFEHPLLTNIYTWEQKSIKQIQETAEKARNDIQHWIDKTKSVVQNNLNQINEQVRSSEKADNYTELDFAKWSKQLEELRNLLEKPSNIEVVEDEKPWSFIRTIKVIDKQPPISCSSIELPKPESHHHHHHHQRSIESIQERFKVMFGPCKLTEDDRVVTHSSYRAGLSQTSGINQYSSGRHSIPFLIEKKGNKNIFIGVLSSSHKIISPTFDYSVHGWWNLDHMIVNGESKGGDSNEIIQIGDKITLIIDCDNQEIQLEHQRSKRLENLPIKIGVCPFPWKILIRLLHPGDSLRILC
ncbi:unnamed protein product [Adineta steineri]|uniref:B box-type domain-containing protein n=1 Tax=Adineta steineri TaxID=433720 RepID=A0A814C3F7_9BILA|nr:unnamed protein product [Adineta steineri]CAF0971709.1 unnamed protein product [Adineta steineri]